MEIQLLWKDNANTISHIDLSKITVQNITSYIHFWPKKKKTCIKNRIMAVSCARAPLCIPLCSQELILRILLSLSYSVLNMLVFSLLAVLHVQHVASLDVKQDVSTLSRNSCPCYIKIQIKNTSVRLVTIIVHFAI